MVEKSDRGLIRERQSSKRFDADEDKKAPAGQARHWADRTEGQGLPIRHEGNQMKHLTDAVERSLQSRNWYAGLIVALSLPDIAGWVENPGQGSQARYAAWFDHFVGPAYTGQVRGAPHKFLSGNDCYALRCSLLHEGRDQTSHQRARDALDRFRFVAPRSGLMIHCNQAGNRLQLQVDLFCRDVCRGIAAWVDSIPASDTGRRGRLAELAMIDFGRGSIRI